MRLPLRLSLDQLQTQWSSQLNPVLANPLLQGNPIEGVVLVANTPQVINHGLGRNMIGWFLTDVNASAQIWRTQPFNSQTLTLEASANCTINLWGF